MTQSADRYVCIHGHFYQPPRENPWLEEIEIQESANPFHDWNARITHECYAPNARARILDPQGRLKRLVSNYEFISFDFGPTLMSWLENRAAETYQAILEADAASVRRRSGHGNAIAQAYNHMIMPLASRRDKITQVVWGIEDFRKRFKRDPEGIWLPETAVDAETLDIVAQAGIRFTILAPRQAKRFRSSSRDAWTEFNPGSIDPSRPYLCHLTGGKSIALFFYDAPISQAIAFEQLLNNGETLVNRLLGGFSGSRAWPQLVHIATDGESYGHHHRFGEMALAYALQRFDEIPEVKLTNYAEFLDKFPASAEVEFVENSSWSCAHGVGRWMEDCSCSVSQRLDWNQKWRRHLRTAMDVLRDGVDRLFLEKGKTVLRDPWAARDAYIKVVLDREDSLEGFLEEHASPHCKAGDREVILLLMEMQRNRMLMYTSCGWFFDDITGIESLQILRYSARVLQLAHRFNPDLIGEYLSALSLSQSNVKPQLHGDEIFREQVMPQITGLARVAAHVAVSSMFEPEPPKGTLYCYDVELLDQEREESGERVLLVGSMALKSRVLGEHRTFSFAVVHIGGVDLRCSLGEAPDPAKRLEMARDLKETFHRQSSTELIRRLDRYFPGKYYSLRDLFADQRRRIVDMLTEKMFEEQARQWKAFYDKNKDLARIIVDHDGRPPEAFLAAARFVLQRSFTAEMGKLAESSFPDKLEAVMAQRRLWKIEPDSGPARQLISNRILMLLRDLELDPHEESKADEIVKFLDLAANLDIQVDLIDAQVSVFRIVQSFRHQAGTKIPRIFVDLAGRLSVSIDGAEAAGG